MLAFYEDPKPHFNTLSTIVRGLEEKGFLAHYTFGNTYQYYPVVSEEDFRKGTLRNVISKYFNNSYHEIVLRRRMKRVKISTESHGLLL